MDVRVPAAATSFLAGVGDVALFASKALRSVWTPPFEVGETIRQLFELGFRSAPLIAVSGMAVGVVLSMHTRASLERFGAESVIPAGLASAAASARAVRGGVEDPGRAGHRASARDGTSDRRPIAFRPHRRGDRGRAGGD